MTTPPRTGPEAIHAALAAMDLDAMEKEQRDVIASKKKTARPRAVRMLRIIEGLRKNEMAPDKLMINSVPVIPPKFRPFAITGDTFLPGDANELYKDIIEYKRLYDRTEKDLGRESTGEVYSDLVKSVRAAYGFGESPNPKVKSRAVKGFFDVVTGASPKTSLYQSKMLSKPVDLVGRGVIIPDADYGMDDVGLPEEMAWKLYGNYVQRRLVRGGMAPPAALKHLKDRSPQAMKALEAEMPHRPVILTRSPAWHRFNVIGQTPRLIKGDAIKINTFITSGLNADFDGNCVLGGVKMLARLGPELHVTNEHNADFDEKINTISIDPAAEGGQAAFAMKVTHNTKIIAKLSDGGVVVEIPIKELPVLDAAPAKDKNGALVYAMPPGVSILTNAPDGLGVRWESVRVLTVEEGCELVDLKTTSGSEVGVSSNESVAVPDGLGGFAKVTPEAALGQLMPFTNSLPATGVSGRSFEWGWMLGAFLSDGWVSSRYIGYTKASDAHRNRFLREFCKFANFNSDEVRRYEAILEADQNCGIGGVSKKLHFMRVAFNAEAYDYLLNNCYDLESAAASPDGRPCLHKCMPSDIWSMSDDALVGLLSGLLDGDGSISVNNSRSKPQVLASFSTSSPSLRDGVLLLLRRLSIRAGVSVSHPKKGRAQKVDNYCITIATPDLARWASKIQLCEPNAGLDMLRAGGVAKDDRDVVPVPNEFVDRIIKQAPAGVAVGSLKALRSRWRKFDYISSSRAKASEWLAVYEGDKDAVYDAAAAYTNSKDLLWEKVVSVTPRPTEPVYDILVPSTKVYVIANGMVIYDTAAVHVPSTPEALADVKDKLMASKMLWSIKNRDEVVPQPKHEQIIGLTMGHDAGGKKRRFATDDEAMKAIEDGQIDLNDDIEIG